MILKPLTITDLPAILALDVLPEQRDFVASNEESLTDAARPGVVSEALGLYEGKEPVGFALLGYHSMGEPDEPAVTMESYCLWRLMIDGRFQGKGLGTRAMEAICAHVRAFPLGPARYLWVSYEPENNRAKDLYKAFGFRETGESTGGEAVAVLPL